MRFDIAKDTETGGWLVVDTETGTPVFWREGVRSEWECLDRAGYLNWRATFDSWER